MLKNKAVLYFAVSFVVLFLDQLSKILVDSCCQLAEKIEIPGHIISFEKVYNTGAAFSILQNNTILIIFISILTIAFICWFVLKKKNILNTCDLIALACITGGATGNLLDRFVHFFVVDFIQLEFVNFPIFNIADIFINIGVIILLLRCFRFNHE